MLFADPTSGCGQVFVACAHPSSVGYVEGNLWCWACTMFLQPSLSQYPEDLSTVFSAVTPAGIDLSWMRTSGEESSVYARSFPRKENGR